MAPRNVDKLPTPAGLELSGRAYRLAGRAEGLSLILLDAGIVVIAWTIATGAAMSAADAMVATSWFVVFIVLATAVQMLVHRAAGMYGPVWEYASVEEAVRVATGVLGGVAVATATIVLVGWSTSHSYPLSTAPPLAALLSLLGCGGVRFQARLFAVERREAAKEPDRLRTLVVGAGASGAALSHELRSTEAGANVSLVGFVDPDPALVGRSVRGLPVLGTTDDLVDICREHQVDRVLITTVSSRPEGRAILARALRTDAQVKVLSPSRDRVDGPLVRGLRDLEVTDLLGRDPAPVDSDEIGSYLRGATVLVTGAGGSIGSEIVRQVAGYEPARLLLVDRDETLLHDLTTGSLQTSAAIEPVLADICDEVFVQQLFDRARPDVVFHAAAQKHVPILEQFPAEAVRVNLLGTLSLAATAARFGVRRFVHISTDKAADPCSVMGATKRAAEQVVFELGRRNDVPFVAVRFGNVLASRGSVVPTFLRQILDGGPVTVTDAAMTRYFMTIPEAVSLVLQSGAMADKGRVYLLDMGEPVSILALANQMIRVAGLRPGEDVAVEIVGIRPGERLHERLHDDAEVVQPAGHPSISSLDAKSRWEWPDLMKRLTGLRQAVVARDDDQIRCQLEELLRAGGVDCTLIEGGSGGSDVAAATAAPPPPPRS